MPDPQDINNPFFHEPKTTKVSEQDKFKFDPSTAKPVQNKSMVAEVEGFNFDPSTAKAVDKGLGGHIKDFGKSLAADAAGLPDLAIGIGDLYSGGRAGKAIEDSGIYTPGSGRKFWNDQKSINSKAQEQEFAAADGIIDKTKVALSNPSLITNAIGESLASMAAGGLAGRAVNVASKGAIGAAASGAIGEGTVMAGSQAENIRQETDDGLLTNGQVGAAVATGVAGSAFGYLGGRIAKELGFSDIDNMLANGVRAEAVQETAKKIPMSTIPKSILYGAVSEGILEELPQSVSEQALQNIALGKPWNENLDDAAVMGTLAGMAMGGGINAYTSTQDYLNAQRSDNGGASPTDSNAPNLPALPGGNGGDALTGEYIPHADQSSQPEQSRTNYEYDQFSTDADNLLGQGTGFNPMQGNYPENPDSPIAPTTPPLSRQLGINPEDGPMSTAAALAVDSGATTSTLNAPTVTDTKQDEINNNAPLSNAAGLLNAPTANTSTSNSGQDESTLTSTTGDGSLRQASDSQLRDESGLLSTTANSSGSESANDSSSNDLEQSGNSSVISNAIGDDGKDASGGINNVDSVSGVGEPSQATQGQSDRNNVNTVENDSVLSEENAGTATSSSAIGAAAGDSQSRTVDPILGVDGQNKWFASQDKANAFIEKKKLGNDYQVVQNDKRFEIQPKESQLSAITPKVDAVTPTIDNKIKTMQHQFDSEKSIPKKVHLQKQLEDLKAQRADITTQEQLQVPVQKQAISSSFQTQPLDHGTLNVPLVKRGNIDNQLDRYKKEQAAAENEKREVRNSEHVDAKSVAKPMFDTLSSDHIKVYADKAGIKPSEAKKELKSMAHWQPEKAIKVFEALKAVKAEQNNLVTPPTLPNLGGVEEIQALEQQLAVEKNVPQKARLRKQIAELQKNNPIDQGAHEAATSIQNDLPEPTHAQIEAGNYKKGHIKVHGLDIAVENPRGSTRSGKDPDGKEWAHTMSDHYGYIKRTKGADDEHIDTYVGSNPESEQVFVIDQLDQQSDGFDEHKVMLGFNSQEDAVKAYQANFDKGWKVGPIKAMNKDQFKAWLRDGDTSKPAASKNLKDSIENIRAEKIRKKTVDDLHRLFASAPDIDLEKSITRLDKAIQKNHEKSIGEMSGGKRSTRKAVASGAVDNFRKQKMDLEAYLKARKSGEVKQRETSAPEKLYSYAGQSSLGIDSSKLNQAFSMMEQGVHSELIRKETGWFLGYDKQWRYEISDRNASLKYSGKRASTIASNAKRNLGKDDLVLADVFNHDELFKAYPQLKNIKFEISDDNLFAGGYDPHSNTMSIDTGSSSEEMLSTVLHEMQHAIQDVEGFARGGNSFEFLQTDGVASYAERNPYGNEFQEALLKFQGTPEYDHIQNEMIQAMISDDAEKSTVANNKMQNFIKKNGLSNLQDKMNVWDSKNSPSAKYNRLAGEVESRDVEARKNLSDHERLNQKPYESQGIPHEDVIVRFNNDAAQRTDTTAQQVRQKLEQRYGKNLIAKLQREGKLDILDTHSEAGAEGWYQNGKVTLVADALTDDSIIPTFLHELGGHAGFQNIISKAKYSELMAMFNDMIKRGHPMAIAAKELAERESNLETQQLEYLPYLLTLASTMQGTNALQKSAIKRFIDKVMSAVKAFVFDKLGVNLTLSPDDMVALAERMIDKSSDPNVTMNIPKDRKLFSRRSESTKSSFIQKVRDVLVERFGEDVISELERQGKLEIIQDYQVEGVEGFYYNGKAVLVASNLTKESAVPTFLHELGGHGGFQNMMNEKQYQELMRQFDKLVEQGNPVALAAKLLAEREQGTERQQLEYLPYLLTLSSTMQQRNVIQRNALQKLIHNIVAYVKAWAFDQFGINLNLNPDDMLALSERMIGQIKHQSSLDLIRQKYHGTSQWMTAPNGAKTHLSEQQWLQVRTPEFKKWFGDWENDAANASQVLDENGEPKVVYHGTATEFNEFKQGHGLLGDGIYLTDSFDIADVYANVRGKNGFVIPLFVNIRNAFKTTGNVSRDKFVEATSSGKYQGVVHQFENKEYIVALEPNQVKMAEGNTGTFNSESSDIRFSRSSNYEDITNRIANGFKNLPKAGDLINKKGVDWLSIGLGLLSRRHLTEVYGKLLPQLNKYNELAAQMDADKNDIAADADNIVREWSKLKDEEALANVMHDATLAQIDPAKPYQQGDNKVKYQQLLHAYNNLSPEAQAMYKKARNAYSGHYAKVREAIRERILRSALSSQKKADLLKNIEGSFGQIKGVYFPLARFGKYVVVMRNQNGQAEVISRAETNNEAESIRSELMKKYPQYKADDVKKDAEFSASRDSVGRGFMSDLFDEVGNLGLDKKAQADFEDTLSQLYLSSMPDLSWAKHGIHRKGTAGFSQDARRAFAQHMFSGANYLGKLRYGDQLAQQLDEMKKYSNEQFNKGVGYDQHSAQSVIDEMEKRHELLMNPKGNPLSSFLTSVGFMYYMGLSPAAAMVNLSQTALIAYPLMGAKWNYDKAGKELLKASKDFAKGVEFNVPDFSSLESFKNSIGDVYSPNIDKVIKGLELDAYNEAVKRGVIDVTQAHDLAGIAQGEDSKVMWYFRPAMRLASGMFHHAERFNREVTFIAAYRLASQAGATQIEAFDQAMDMVYRGHFDYSTGNRARFMQGNIAKVVLLFKQYAQNMIYTLVRNAHQSIYALDPKDQREARRALAGILGMHALAAGAIGLPITGMLATASILIAKKSKLGAAAFGIAAAVAFASGGDDDDPYKLENVIRNWLSDIHPKFADLVFGGLPRAFSPVDLSGRVGLNNLIIPDVQDGLEGADWAKAMQSALLGPVVGISTNAVKGIQEINNGDYGRGIETMLPVALKNAMKSYRFANEGVLTKNKDVIQEEVGAVGLFSQAIGFSPSDVKTSMEGRSAIYDYKTKLEKHRKDLMRQWVVAKRDDDRDGMDKAWAEILEFNKKTNDKNPDMRIKRINLMQSYKSNERRAKDTGDGGVYLTKRQKGAEEQGGFAFNH